MNRHSSAVRSIVALAAATVCVGACSSSSPSWRADGDAERIEANDAVEESTPSDGDLSDEDPVGDYEQTDFEESVEAEEAIEVEAAPDLRTRLYGGLTPVSALNVHDRLGVATHMDQGVGDNADRAFELGVYQGMGGLRIREDFSWSSIEPTRGDWRFEGLDVYVAAAKAAGVDIVALLDYSVGWAQSGDTTDTLDPALFAAFAGKVAERYCADIKNYEVWNEQNIKRFWTPEPNPDAYGDLLEAAYPAITTACPDAVVLFGGMASMTVDQYIGRRWWFLDDIGLTHPDICRCFDVMALHPYTYIQASSPEQDYGIGESIPMQSQTEMHRLAREKLTALGCGDKPVWYTEMGWPSYDLSEDTVARFLARSALIAMKDDVQGYFWYDFFDGEPITTGSRPHENYFGLFGWPGDSQTPRREKPAFRALKGLDMILGTSYFARDLSPLLGLPDDVYALAFVDDAGGVTVAAWDGRENPDGFLGDGQENNPDTVYALDLPLPEGTLSLTRYDQEGVEMETIVNPGDSLALTLTAKAAYVRVGTDPPPVRR